jgi:hypothetical protein
MIFYKSKQFQGTATIAAGTPSTGNVNRGKCSTVKNRRLSLPSIGDDQA